jgi:vacuolar protein sorting-associated protein 13A/C
MMRLWLELPRISFNFLSNLQLIQYLERDWSIKTEIPAEPAEFIVWTLNSYDSAGKTSMQLGVRFENLNNGLTMTVYCPFWMLNKTGLNLSYRVSFAI